MFQVNIPEVLADLTSAFDAYERALIESDIETLNALFWKSECTVRYGVRELLYGHDEIARFRIERGAIDQRRSLRNVCITTFGRDFGTANTEYLPSGSDRIGRQSQTWIRTDDGWRIVSAHVSFLVCDSDLNAD
jgi:AtzH-like